MSKEVSNEQILDAIVSKVKKAQEKYATYTQAEVDKIFKQAAIAANKERISLSKFAHEETGRGVVEDKVIKNHYAAEYVYNAYKNTKTCGVIEDDKDFKYQLVAEPIGIIAGVVPTTNPTSTAIFKCLLALKTRNGIIFSPHPAAKKSTIQAARIILEAAVKAGAPKDIIGWIEEPSIELSAGLMNHKDVDIILATGGPGMVKQAYSSGKPAVGVGPGNTPVFIDASAEIEMSVSSIILSKTFDNGMICASEQAIVVASPIYDEVKKEFEKRGCYFVSASEKKKLGDFFFKGGHLNADVVGMSAYKIANWSGFKVPEKTKILIAECTEVSDKEAFAHEKLSPILGFYKAKDFEDGLKITESLVTLGGAGHTSVIYTAKTNKEHMNIFRDRMKTGRILINTPASQGAIGDLFNFRLPPSLTLGCGSWGKNSTSENVGVKHLMNIKQVANRTENMLWHRIPPKIYFKPGCLRLALEEIPGKRAFIVSDQTMQDLGQIAKVTEQLDKLGKDYRVFAGVKPDPTLSTIAEAMMPLNEFQPDSIIALGGGSAIDAAKIMWLQYEHPEIDFDDIAMRFVDIRKRVVDFPEMGKKAYMVAIATTSGTGSEVTPFAVITDDKTNQKYPIADYALTPNMAILDAEFVMSMPPKLTAYSGVDAMTHAVEAYVAMLNNSFADAQALEALRIIFKHLPTSYKEGANAPKSKELMHNASAMAGIAFANAFLGICHSMAHKLGARFNVPHGLANALLISHVIDFTAVETPTKQGTFAQYEYPFAIDRYAAIADAIEVGNREDSNIDKVKALLKAIEALKSSVDIPKSIKETGVDEAEFMKQVDAMSEEAFDDQCTGAAPRYPLISEIKELYIKAFNGDDLDIMK